MTCCDQKARQFVFLDKSLTPVTNCVCESLLSHLTTSEGLVSRLLIRTITEGSTAVMQLGQKPLSHPMKCHIVFIQSLRPNPLLLWQNLEWCLKASIPVDFWSILKLLFFKYISGCISLFIDILTHCYYSYLVLCWWFVWDEASYQSRWCQAFAQSPTWSSTSSLW